ncbi:MAG: hypothetical protein E6X32_02525 [Varibaculum cambriense]|uniref:hypothetical protein n=1 Tax=Varibaculum cambriense TaxID=184870 RepID=UPI00290FBD06|nr:hypothetical protein [Varibaculum cambriense]MDU4944467.1 hypothetical protein [Varibaculum cambriense]
MEFIGLALPILVLIVGGIYLPLLIDSKRRQTQSHGDDRFSANLRVLNTQQPAQKRQRYSVNPPVLGGTMQRPVAPTQRDHSELMSARLTRARQIERRSQAARRRLTLVTVQFAIGMVLVTAAAVSLLSWWWTLIPLATIAGTLCLGARAAKAGRENDQRAQELIHALETRPAKGHRVSASEKKFAQMHAEASDPAASSGEHQTSTATTASELKAESTGQKRGQTALGKLAAAARRAATLREYFVIHEDETAEQAEETAKATTREIASSHSQSHLETGEESAAVTLVEEKVSEDKEPVAAAVAEKETTTLAEITEISAEDSSADATEKAETAAVTSHTEEAAENQAEADHTWTPTPMPKPIYALKPRLARRDVDASELLAEHLATQNKAPYRPSRPHPHSEESLTTAQLVAQSKPVDVEAILDNRRIAN